jgi:hypothetical protein
MCLIFLGSDRLATLEVIRPTPLIGPCQHTIRNQGLIVPFEGFEHGLTGRSSLGTRGRLIGGEAASFYRMRAVTFDKEVFFKKQIEDCRELERQAVSADDRSFWRQTVARWEAQLRQAQQTQPRKKCVSTPSASNHPHPNRHSNADPNPNWDPKRHIIGGGDANPQPGPQPGPQPALQRGGPQPGPGPQPAFQPGPQLGPPPPPLTMITVCADALAGSDKTTAAASNAGRTLVIAMTSNSTHTARFNAPQF